MDCGELERAWFAWLDEACAGVMEMQMFVLGLLDLRSPLQEMADGLENGGVAGLRGWGSLQDFGV